MRGRCLLLCGGRRLVYISMFIFIIIIFLNIYCRVYFHVYGVQGNSLYKSPFARTARLIPPCLASACSMWSRNPIPVLMVICCVAVNWVAWLASLDGTMPFLEAEASWGSVGAGKWVDGS